MYKLNYVFSYNAMKNVILENISQKMHIKNDIKNKFSFICESPFH